MTLELLFKRSIISAVIGRSRLLGLSPRVRLSFPVPVQDHPATGIFNDTSLLASSKDGLTRHSIYATAGFYSS